MIEPPSVKQLLCSHAGYVAWANGRILAACSALSAEELERDLSTSHVNIIGVLRHMYYAERVWQKRLRENLMPPLVEVGDQRLFRDASPEPDLAALRDRWPAVWHGRAGRRAAAAARQAAAEHGHLRLLPRSTVGGTAGARPGRRIGK